MSLEKSIFKLAKVIQAVRRPQTRITKPYGRDLPSGCECTHRAPDSDGMCVAISCNDGTNCTLYWTYDVVEWRCSSIGVQQL